MAQPRIIRSARTAVRKRDLMDGDGRPATEPSQICLLELFLPGSGTVQRRAIQVQVDGELVWREMEIVTSFGSRAEAIAYAAEHGIADVDL